MSERLRNDGRTSETDITDETLPATSLPVDARWPRHLALWPLVLAHAAPGELAHDGAHLARVYRWALALAPEAGVDPDRAGAAALTHDLAAIPKDSPDRALGGEVGARLASTPLAAVGYASDDITAIVEAIRTSSWSRGHAPTSPLGALLQDADRLDAIGAVGIARTFACAQHMSSPRQPGAFAAPTDPLARGGRALDDRRFALDHFAAKLLKLADGMHLPGARAEARRRHDAMLAFLAEFERELG